MLGDLVPAVGRNILRCPGVAQCPLTSSNKGRQSCFPSLILEEVISISRMSFEVLADEGGLELVSGELVLQEMTRGDRKSHFSRPSLDC